MNTESYRLPETEKPPLPKHPKLAALPHRPTEAQLDEHKKTLTQYSIDLALYEDQKQVWDAYWEDRHQKQGKLYGEFFEDAREDLGYGDHPKKARLEAWADEHGHSSGCSGMWDYLQMGWELLKD